MQLQKETTTLSDADFLRLIEEKGDSFYRVAYGYVRNAEDAKDIVQEAVCKAYVGGRSSENSGHGGGTVGRCHMGSGFSGPARGQEPHGHYPESL